MMRGLVLAVALTLFGAMGARTVWADPSLPESVEAQTGPEKLADPVLEARAVALQKQFRCLVCQGESLDESNASLAQDLRRLIRAKIAAGASNDEITHYLVSRYGDFILMKPPLMGQTYVLWFGPFAVLLLAGGIAAAVIVRARARANAVID